MTIQIRSTKLPKYCQPKEGSKYLTSKFCIANKTKKTLPDGYTVRKVWTAYHYVDTKAEAIEFATELLNEHFNPDNVVIYKM